jgi:hypothetical protein
MANYTDRLGPSGKFVENSTKLTYLEITCYRIMHSTVLWLLELQIRHGRKVLTHVHTVNSNSWTSNCLCRLFSKKNPIIWIFCISRWLSVPINRYKWSSLYMNRHALLSYGKRPPTLCAVKSITYTLVNRKLKIGTSGRFCEWLPIHKWCIRECI